MKNKIIPYLTTAIFITGTVLANIITCSSYTSLPLNKVYEIQALLISGFCFVYYLEKYLSQKFVERTLITSLIFTFVRSALALLYLTPLIFGDNEFKEQLSVLFMVNYLVYLAYSSICKIRYT